MAGSTVSWAIVFLLLVTWTNISQARRSRGDGPHYRTAYACEGSQLSIACEEGHFIHLIRANFGRFSISICNEHGSLDWSVDCMSRLSFRVMQESCGMKSGCSLPASSVVFGDPCPGTLKYLEAHYQCMPESPSTTRKPPPPIVFPPTSIPPPPVPPPPSTTSNFLPPPINVSFVAHTTTIKASSTTTTLKPYVPPTPNTVVAKVDTSRVKEVERGDINPEENTVPPMLYRPVHSTTDLSTDYCSPVSSRGLYWNWTRAGETVIQKCPFGARGEARWHCSLQSMRWYPDRPDLGGCSYSWIDSLEDRIQEGDSVVNIAADFAHLTKTKMLFGGDIVQAMGIIQRLVSKMEDKVIEFPDERQRYQVVKELVQSVVDIGSNLLEPNQNDAWGDLSDSEQREAASAMLHGLERNVRLLADTQNREAQFSHAQNNILVTMNIVRAQTVTDLKLPVPEAIISTTWRNMEDSIHLPAGALLETSRNSLAKAVFLSYNQLDRILTPNQPPAIYRSPQTAEELSVVQIINSRVVTVSLGRERFMRLSDPVILVLKHLREENVTNPRCVFWDFTGRSWSENGCQVKYTNRSHTVCSCNHLTNFAILMDVQAIPLPFGHELALRVITYIGCVISIICLVMTILTFQLLRGLKSDRTTIHKNLCFCLLVAEVVFVAGINQTQMREVCGVIAGVLHYFFLAAFLWMFLEGFQLYVMLVEVFETEKSRVKWYYAVAYLIPAVIVAISAFIDPHSYGSDNYCWLRADNYFIFSFVGPVIAILLANIVFLTIAIYMMCRHANMAVVTKTKEQAKLTSICVWIRGAMVLVFLLGLTWAFGLLYLSVESVIMAYVFTILNSLQGLFIFVFHCIKNEKVQKEYLKILHHMTWLPECIRGAKAAEQRSSFYVHSNGTVSGQGNSSGQLSNSQQHSWLSKDKSSNNTSVPKSTIQVEDENQTESSRGNESTLPRTLKNNKFRSANSTLHSSNQTLSNTDNCNNTDSGASTLPPGYNKREAAIAQNELRTILQHAYPKYHQHHSPPPPYGQMSNNGMNPFMDHIYECIDTDCDTPTYKKRYIPVAAANAANLAAFRNVMLPEGHMRSHSDSSRQSSASSNCDQKPLIGGYQAPNLPQRNAIANLAQVLNTAPHRMNSLSPGQKELFLRHQLQLQQEAYDEDDPLQDELECNPADFQGDFEGDFEGENTQGGYHLTDPHLVACATSSPLSHNPLHIIQNPSDNNAAVMAVLDGEKVVCRLSPETVSATNSPNTRTHYCHKFSHLSTDC